MLTLRLKRTGRTGHALFRLVAQDRRYSPSSGRVAAYLGNYDPHTKKIDLDIDKINEYLTNGAQPSPRVITLLEKEGVKLPDWVRKASPKKRAIRNPEKLRKNRPAEAQAEAKEETEVSTTAESTPTQDEKTESPAKEANQDEPKTEASEPAEAKPEESESGPEKPEVEPAVEDQPKAEA